MKFSILQQDLLPVLSSVSRSVGIRSTLPVLGNILISAEEKKIKLVSTNLEIGVIKYISADVLEEGEITIPAKTIVELIQSLGSVKIDFETEGEILNISSGKFKASINGIGANEFPVIPLPEGTGISFKKEELKSCAQILFASAVDEGRPVLTGILTQLSGGRLDFVATDGFRLAHKEVKIDDLSEFKSLIPRKTFEEVLRIVGEVVEDEVGIEIYTNSSQNQIIFKIAQTVVSSRLIEGSFPSWEKIIPSEFKARAVIDRGELVSAAKLASVFAKTDANTVTFKVQKDRFIISSQAKELGSQINEVEAQVEGEELEIAYNSKFLLDVLSAADTTQLIMEFSGPLSPTLVKPVGVEGLEYILMPVRLS
ncbi:DNA polymerase III subunit beta [Candidatus Daviesbacteria bacterium RIFCSPHIGHO2_12_FULL_37_11]|uniref:Beta sliding clamp n=1 Tax=Candidatus Daviesbacteria bacterium RIFCSPHIGHO2_12_FULL_37_11 TaxID=1797777 RepID=A0A1F5K940_9BACT|nr:MAG: DNA polymerase III subunit beta [Candidatus Daviesbacteria bacterium RIFCSPHIGHO2_01_FULL_37_27]OGE37472.1 MAG: DNA polymerase III subunit beta [Candidatus Daviesbacteria bacterium RIFCSPHIGHO2_12_FULL_37_11]OGE45997.1 MAG: DNA polymerase III subunit beta [Candidatus Daviesbacteria bacterium RIFCSPLOWO2_01_FULL_37_10]